MHAQVAGDLHAAIHCSLHGLLDIIKPDIDAALKFGEGLSLEDKGAEVTASVASLAAYDLRYNPRSLRSWDSLASKVPCPHECAGGSVQPSQTCCPNLRGMKWSAIGVSLLHDNF